MDIAAVCLSWPESKKLGDLVYQFSWTFVLSASVVTFNIYYYSLDRAHMILDEIVGNGTIIECNKRSILDPVYLLDTVTKKGTA